MKWYLYRIKFGKNDNVFSISSPTQNQVLSVDSLAPIWFLKIY